MCTRHCPYQGQLNVLLGSRWRETGSEEGGRGASGEGLSHAPFQTRVLGEVEGAGRAGEVLKGAQGRAGGYR